MMLTHGAKLKKEQSHLMKCVLATCVPYHQGLKFMPHLYENGSILTHYSISCLFHLRINLGVKYSF